MSDPFSLEDVDIEVETWHGDFGPVASIAYYTMPGCDEVCSCEGVEEHEAVGLAKLDIIRRWNQALMDKEAGP